MPNGMANEEICQFDHFPEMSPQISLRGSIFGYQVAPQLDMAPVDHRPIRSSGLGERNNTRHLWIVHNDEIRTTFSWWSQGAAFREPVSLRIFTYPVVP